LKEAQSKMQQPYSHLKAMLWASPTTKAYAVVSGSVIPGLRDLLGQSDVLDWDCLWRGALPPEKAAQAPYVIELDPHGRFTDWLLQEAGQIYPDWGVIGLGPVGLMAMREHGRSLLDVLLPDGQRHRWTWHDPVLWASLLPRLDALQLDAAYGPLTDWVMVRASVWQWFTLSAGQLIVTPRECMPAAAA
jgi:hypothetical protein